MKFLIVAGDKGKHRQGEPGNRLELQRGSLDQAPAFLEPAEVGMG